MVKIAVIVYSTYSHVLELSKSEVEGAKSSGATVDTYQFASQEPRDASVGSGYPLITPEKLAEYDGFLLGFPTRFGSIPFAVKDFFDTTGAEWQSGAFHGKFGGFFVSTGTQGGGQEATVRNALSMFAHHGIIYVPLGYGESFPLLTSLEEVHGGSPWGAGTFAGADGSRKPSSLEKKIAYNQGKSFAVTVLKGINGSSAAVPTQEEVEEQKEALSKLETEEDDTTAAGTAAGTSNAAVSKADASKDAAVSNPTETSKTQSAPSRSDAPQSSSEKQSDTKKSGCCCVIC